VKVKPLDQGQQDTHGQQETTSVENMYPQQKERLNPYDGIPENITSRWSNNCNSKCSWTTCAPAQQPKLDAQRRVMKEFLRLASSLNVQPITCAGSLIAALYRNSTIMRWDHDIDTMIWAHETIKFEEIREQYNKENQGKFYINVQPEWRRRCDCPNVAILRVDPIKTPKNGGGGFVAPNMRLVHVYKRRGRKQAVWMDVFPVYAEKFGPEEGAAIVQNNTFQYIEMYSKVYVYNQIPKSSMFPLQSCYLEGMQFWCPRNGEEVLTKAYKRNVRAPDHHLNLNTGCWVKGAK
jgi:hypothetical protein